jgi:transposase-like protein
MKKTHTAEFKAKMVIEALQEAQTLNQIAATNGINPNLLSRWKSEAINSLPHLFRGGVSAMEEQRQAYETKIEELYMQIGKLTTEAEWLKKKYNR